MGVFFARQVYRLKIVTISDFFRIRYNRKIELISSLVGVYTFFPWIAAQFLAIGILFNAIIGIPISWGILLGAFVVLLYTYIGGMWAVSITDIIQAVIIVGGLVFITYKLLGQTEGLAVVLEKTPKGFFKFLPESGIYNWIDYVSDWIVIGIGAITAQEIYQRVLSARSESAGANGIILSGFILFIISTISLINALCISQIYPHLLTEYNDQNIIPSMILVYTSMPVQIMFFGALISAILSTSSGAILSAATIFSENLVKPYFKNISDKQLIYITRMGVIFAVIISTIFAFFDTSIHSLVLDSITVELVCLVVPFILGLKWKKASINGVWAAFVIGGLTWGICKSIDTQIEPWMYGCFCSLLAMVFVSLIMPDDSGLNYEKIKLRILSTS